MKLIVCIDDKLGMAFNNRRQSKDSALRADILTLTDGKLWMNTYSAAQFEEANTFYMDDDFLDKAAADDYCFVENADIAPYAERVSGVILYRWNRHYPSDRKFPMELFEDRWILESTFEFPGSSHETITREVYAL